MVVTWKGNTFRISRILCHWTWINRTRLLGIVPLASDRKWYFKKVISIRCAPVRIGVLRKSLNETRDSNLFRCIRVSVGNRIFQRRVEEKSASRELRNEKFHPRNSNIEKNYYARYYFVTTMRLNFKSPLDLVPRVSFVFFRFSKRTNNIFVHNVARITLDILRT